MARGFGANGVDGNDRIVTTCGTVQAGVRSYSVWYYRTGSTGGGLGRVWDKQNTSTAQPDNFQWVNASSNMRYSAAWTGTPVNWDLTGGSSASANVWLHAVVIYDNSSDANVPIFYTNGVLGTTTVIGPSPSGSPATTTDTYVLGNRSSTTNRNWDGFIAEFAVWDGITLTTGEITALSAGYSPALIRPNALIEYVPLIRDSISVKRGATTVTGTAIQPHTRIIYPKTTAIMRPASGGGTQDLTPTLFTNTQTFFTHVVESSGNLAPTLFTNTNTFFTHTVTAGAVNLLPTLFTNTNTFFTAVITTGSVDIAPNLYTNPSNFFLPTVHREGDAEVGTTTGLKFIADMGLMTAR